MRVVFLSQCFDAVLPPQQNSVGIVTYEIARRLAADEEVTVLAVGGFAGSRCTSVDGMAVEQLACAPPRVWNIASKAWSRAWPRARPLYTHSFYALDYLLQALRRIRHLRPDVVHVQNFPQHLPLVRRAAPDAAIVLHMHCDWLTQLDDRAMGRAIEDSDIVVGCSEHVMGLARQKFRNTGRRFEVLPNGAPVEVAPPSSRALKQPKVLFVGRVSPEKGLHTLLAAWPRVVAKHPQARLELIGAETSLPRPLLIDLSNEREVIDLARFYAPGISYGEALRAMVPDHVGHTVSFRGPIPYDAVKLAMAEAAVVVNPSFSESFGMSLIEALSEETPVIATNVGGMPEIVRATGGGELVPRNAPDALAEAINRRLDNPVEGAEIGRHGRERILECYAWPRIASLTRDYHLEAIAVRQRRSAEKGARGFLKNV